MKKICLFGLGLIALAFVGCGDKVSDPEALYQKYLKDDATREKKLAECRLLSVDEQLKSQTCEIANKAAGEKFFSGGLQHFKPTDLNPKKQQGKKE